MPYTFRPAVESDVQAIADIYNASVMAGGATADLTPRTFDQRRAWVESHTPPYGVFVVESEDGSIIGFGALSVFYDRAGYDGVTDLAYYIDPAWQGRGVGTFMLDRLLTEALARHMRKACGIIFADNAGSIALMHRFGVYGQINVYGVTTKSERHKRSYWTRTADGNGIGGRKAPVPYGS